MIKDKEIEFCFQAMSEIAIIGHLADTALGQTLPEDLSVARFGVLNHFVRLKVESESPAQLARAFQVTKGAMTYTLQRLDTLGYVSIEGDPRDARAKLVRPTKAGLKARAAAIARVAPGMRRLMEHVGVAEFRAAMPFLIKLRQVLDAARN